MTRDEAAKHDQLPADVDMAAHYGEGKLWNQISTWRWYVIYNIRFSSLDIARLVEKRFKQEKIIQEYWN